MELHPKFYEDNPFEQPLHFRVQGAAAMDTQQLYALFVKNLIASIFFEEKGANTSESQQNLYQFFMVGSLYLGTEAKPSPILIFFASKELVSFSDVVTKDALNYCAFIQEQIPLFRRIDLLCLENANTEAGMQFLSYLSENYMIYTQINISLVGNLLEDFFIQVCKGLCVSYIYHFDESGFFVEDLAYVLAKIELAMKLDLLNIEEQEELITYSKRWISQRFKDFAFSNGMPYAINEMEGTYLFEKVIQYFIAYFSKNTTHTPITMTQEHAYPAHIFSSYQGFHLFDTLAKGLQTKATLSYVYRLLHEKGFIFVKDTPFREWYNQQGYPIQLHTATETLLNSKSVDREQFVQIIAKLLHITL